MILTAQEARQLRKRGTKLPEIHTLEDLLNRVTTFLSDPNHANYVSMNVSNDRAYGLGQLGNRGIAFVKEEDMPFCVHLLRALGYDVEDEVRLGHSATVRLE